jgi:predicted metal-dependent phosphoesterase TrpH
MVPRADHSGNAPARTSGARPSFDLQSHSVHSDGALQAHEVVDLAAAAGVEWFALSDHDTVDGVGEALEAARRHGIRLSPAAELSAVHRGYEDLHVLGYELRHDDPDLRATLHDLRGDRARRIEDMAHRMRELGFELDETVLNARRAAGKPLGRPHLADAILGHPANADRLREEGIDGRNALFPAYLVPGAPGYVPRSRPTIPQAIEIIHAAGGIAVWAHPLFDVEPEELDEVLAAGFDGIEVFYVHHDEEQTRLLYDECVRRGIYTTGSADFHGPEHESMNTFRNFSLFGLEPRVWD